MKPTIVAALVGVMLVLSACTMARFEASRTASIAAPESPGIDASTRNGGVKISQADIDRVEVVAEIRTRSEARLEAFRIEMTEADGVVTIRAVPPGGSWRSGDACSLDIRTPRTSGVRAETTNGGVLLLGLSGEAEVQTTNGGVRVRGHSGRVVVETTNGGISLDGVGGGEVTATSTNGRIDAVLDEAVPFALRTSNGSITVLVPKGFAGRLKMRTTNGVIAYKSLSPLGARMDLADRTRHSVEVTVGSGGGDCVAQTTNGNISVDPR